ncbi:2-hydroxychromene-2-carboxylate isomerase [Oceanomicrobium pacificus]|uniref:2-hydroxychromene-2-carboxylate isomerase n=1 Tax=Oceanomicrobium pacificus TaxID=2692916 RepID=A0A6B0TNS5_9RHOB|nr:2-hydroxychromene-2-carboxylate isomerase [Oceanomicrobium pacificus]MXU64239.1 2-hydroxychromene-2-carboxylate isomerase [Oceanomicrobium pacificus]
MAHIDYYLFTLSPFTYLAGDGLEKVAEKHGATITYKPFQLMKVFEETGTVPVPQRHESRKANRLQELARIAKRNKLPINLQPAHWPTNPVPSCSAIIAAQEAGGGNVGGLAQALLRACWAEEKNIAEDEVVKACLADNGFDPAILDSAMLSAVGTFERNTEEALRAGVFGAPTYVVDDQVFWGQDRISYLDDYLAERG